MNNVVRLTNTIADQATRTSVEAANAVGIVSVGDTTSTVDNFQSHPR